MAIKIKFSDLRDTQKDTQLHPILDENTLALVRDRKRRLRRQQMTGIVSPFMGSIVGFIPNKNILNFRLH